MRHPCGQVCCICSMCCCRVLHMRPEHLRALNSLRSICKGPADPCWCCACAQVKGLMQMLLGAVAYMHSNNVLHLDLGTSNILLDNSGKLKVRMRCLPSSM